MEMLKYCTSQSMRAFALIILLLCPSVIKAQVEIHLDGTGGEEWLQPYLDQTGSEYGFVYGKEYYPYYYRARNSPILRDDERRTASLTFDGRTYDNLELQYDTYIDAVVYGYESLPLENKMRKVSLNKYELSSFDLYFIADTMHFRYFAHDRDTSFNLDDGFYEVVRDSKTKFIIRHRSEKYINLNTPDRHAFDDYLYKPLFYINTGDGYQKITSRKHFTGLFNAGAGKVSRFLRAARIRIRKADKRQICEVLQYYEQLD